jgi:hypothetical protein
MSVSKMNVRHWGWRTVLVLLVTLPLVLLACGEGKRPPSREVRSVTARFSYAPVPEPQEGVAPAATYEGVGDFGRSQYRATLLDQSRNPILELLQLRGVAYTRGVGDSKWKKTETPADFAAQDKVRDHLVSSGGPLSYLRSVANDVKLVGSDVVRGKKTTHYTATADLAKEGRTPGEMLPVEVWIDESDRVVRYQYHTPHRETFRWEFYDYGVEVDLTPPPDRETL